MKLKEFIKQLLPFLRKRNLRTVCLFFKTIGYGNDLNRLAQLYGTDKWGIHFYTPHYMEHFRRFRQQKMKLLEIGVGGYEYSTCGGESLRMWKRYFSNGRIYAIDLYDKSPIEESRIKIFKGNQVDKVFLNSVLKEIGALDIIIDDGSHINEHVIESFNVLFPNLKENGVYAIEDIQTSYWPEYGGNSGNTQSITTMNYFKKLADGLNYKEFLVPGYEPNYFDLNIVSVHFYHNLIFIKKGRNDKKSDSVINCDLSKAEHWER
jgi:hypothetical protein